MRVVVDTGVLVSALLLRTSTPRRAFDLATTSGRLLVSGATLAELDEVLRRPKFDAYVTPELRAEFLAAYCHAAELVEVVDVVRVCRDPDDDKFLELAVSGRADFVITGDADLLQLHPFRHVAIVRPDQFLSQSPSG